jgi:hypothetical protein
MDLARATGSERSFVVSATLRAVALSEVGRPAEMWVAVAAARAEAERLRIAFGEVVLDGLVVPWLAMAGRFEECERVLEHLRTLGSRISHNNVEEAATGAILSLRLWQGRSLEMVPLLEQFDETVYPFAPSVAVYLWRAGEHDRARAYFAEHGAPLEHDNDISLVAWCHAAELSLHLGERTLAGRCYELLAPYAGLSACAGSSLAIGPVDAYLAMAAAAVGETAVASRHADDAVALATAWELPVLRAWLLETRAAYGF